MKIVHTYIINWKERSMGQDYQSLCKVHLLIDESYIREYDTGKGTKLMAILKSDFDKQKENPLF